MIANFLAVAEIAETLPFLKFIRLKKSDKGAESFRFPIAFAVFLNAIFIGSQFCGIGRLQVRVTVL